MKPDQARALLSAARAAIDGFLEGEASPVPDRAADPALAAPGACFVTLTLRGDLRGCMGSLVPVRPLIDDVRENALAAAFRDPRFAPLSAAEWPHVRVSIAVLGPTRPLRARSRAALLSQLRPGEDGLVLQAPDGRRATFLPAVWEQLPDGNEFLDHLLAKAGLPLDTAMGDLEFGVYQVTRIGEE